MAQQGKDKDHQGKTRRQGEGSEDHDRRAPGQHDAPVMPNRAHADGHRGEDVGPLVVKHGNGEDTDREGEGRKEPADRRSDDQQGPTLGR